MGWTELGPAGLPSVDAIPKRATAKPDLISRAAPNDKTPFCGAIRTLSPRLLVTGKLTGKGGKQPATYFGRYDSCPV